MDRDPLFNSLSKGCTVAMLLKLKESDEPLIMKDFSEIVINYQSRKLRAIELEEDGLINIEVIRSPKKNTCLSLTEKGTKITSILWMIDSIVPGDKTIEKSICQEYAETVLRVLKTHDGLMQTEIREYVPSYTNLLKSFEVLERDGLVRKEVETTGYRCKKFFLTKLGKTVAEGFDNIDKTIREE